MNKENESTGLTAFNGGLAFLIGLLAMLFSEILLTLLIKDNNTLSLVFSYLSQTLFVCSALAVAFKANAPQEKGKMLPAALMRLGFRKPDPILASFAFLLPLLIEFIFAKLGYVNPPSSADYTSSVTALITAGIGLCFFPAFGEEMLVRGALMHGLREKGTLYAIFMSAFAFGVMHGSPTQFIYQFLIGIIMAYIVFITDNLWYSVIFHAVNNTTGVLYNYFYISSGATYSIPLVVYIIMFIVGTALVFGLLLFFTRSSLPEEMRTYSPKKLLSSAINASETGYVGYTKKSCYTFYIALAVIAVLFITNTVSGWTR